MARTLVAAIEREGLLLVQDKVLPSATTLLAGQPVSGSWWSHRLANPIYDALQIADRLAVRVKLVRGKVTFVHRRLWPELVSVGRARSRWQLDGLADETRDLARRAARFRSPVRVDVLLPLADGKARTAVVHDVERRLLLHVDEVHTDSGAHAKVVEGWRTFQRRHAIPDPLPRTAAARATFEKIVAGWPGVIEPVALLPWG